MSGQTLCIAIARNDAARRLAVEEILCRAGLPESVRGQESGGRGQGREPDAHLVYANEEETVGAVRITDKGLFERRDNWRREARAVLQLVTEAKSPEDLAARLFARLPTPDSRLPFFCSFDLIAVAAGLLGRWEEELDPERDEHGRWPLRASILRDGKLVERPVVDWIARAIGSALREALQLEGEPATPWQGAPWAFALTWDIDSAGMYRGGMWPRTVRRAQLSRGIGAALAPAVEGALVLAGARPDPHENDVELADRLTSLDVRSTFFVQAVRESPHDSYALEQSPELVRAMRRLRARGHEIGLHASYATPQRDAAFLRQQNRVLLRQLGVKAALHRAHYLRVAEARDFDLYAKVGLDAECSLGFSEREGFRLGTALPCGTELMTAPMHVMDVTLRYHRQLDTTEAMRAARRIFKAARGVGGMGVLLWHPHNLEPRTWRRWNEMPFELTAWARQEGARVGTMGELLAMWRAFRQKWRLD